MTVVRRRVRLIPAEELHRRTDPDTSRTGVPTQKERGVLCDLLLREFCRSPLTSEEAAHRAGIDPWQASKRVSELIRSELIAPTGDTRPGSSGRAQRVHTATDIGRMFL